MNDSTRLPIEIGAKVRFTQAAVSGIVQFCDYCDEVGIVIGVPDVDSRPGFVRVQFLSDIDWVRPEALEVVTPTLTTNVESDNEARACRGSIASARVSLAEALVALGNGNADDGIASRERSMAKARRAAWVALDALASGREHLDRECNALIGGR